MALFWELISLIYFFLPAYFCNMTPPIAKRLNLLKVLDFPLDRGRLFLRKPLLGAHKTFRGVFLGFFVGFFTAFFQKFLYHFPFFQKISLLDYEKINILWFAFLISSGAVLGDLFFAFLKRRLNLKPGAPFLPFDQTNYVIGAAILLAPTFKIPLEIWVKLFILTFFLHIVVNRLGFHLKIHRAKW